MNISEQDLLQVQMINDYFELYSDIEIWTCEVLNNVEFWIPEYYKLRDKYSAVEIDFLFLKYPFFQWISQLFDNIELIMCAEGAPSPFQD
ncbi:hypothetical protein Sps_03995 [Shewanella psychrophila]|uniref:Uncharacterized protein n=1 Tax=Shewanella psychrophila TaxID=225848 RepID=A0A1S6HU73_9GAMM|nr:hypothetical protein [Shewanella psychrophila]AQS39110.1 hypothetical protein Sps_03995 [Shewanella psychrophila]